MIDISGDNDCDDMGINNADCESRVSMFDKEKSIENVLCSNRTNYEKR